MGAVFNSMEVDGTILKEKVTTEFNARCDQDAYEYGHRYSGSFSQFTGLVFTNKLFNTESEANDYLLEYAEKWGPALAVHYKVIKSTKTVENHLKAISVLRNKLWEAGSKLHKANQKMRINNRSTKPTYVVKAEEANKRVMDSVEPKIAERENKIKQIEHTIAAKSKKTMWLISGWCSE